MDLPKKVPKKFWKLFWDVDASKLDPSEKPLFTVQRVLDKGDDRAVSWVWKSFGPGTVSETLRTMRDFKPRIGAFWSLFLNIPKEKVACLQKPYLTTRKTHWPY